MRGILEDEDNDDSSNSECRINAASTEAQALAWAPDSMRYSRFPPRNYQLVYRLAYNRDAAAGREHRSPGVAPGLLILCAIRAFLPAITA